MLAGVLMPYGLAVSAPPSAVVAGGGIGGLCTALTLQSAGWDVKVFEQASVYRPFGGPIQIASNGLEALKQIDEGLLRDIIKKGNRIGDRKNGLKDGISNEWFATFDLSTPALERGQEPSLVIDRPILQELLMDRVGHSVTLGSKVVGCEAPADGQGADAILANGDRHTADLVIGSDGIRSMMRNVLNPDQEPPTWSGYTCFAAIAYTVPHDIKEVGYKVFLGRRKYFVSVDVGGGRIQWYAFLNVPPGSLQGQLEKGEGELEYLRQEFGGWSEEVFQLIDNTPTEEIEQRDLYDRPPQLKWAEGRVCLLGDAAHPMMPNLGQGGCMAIEDAFVLGRELSLVDLNERSSVPLALKRYNKNRVLRAAAVQGMSRLSSAILFQYNHPTELVSVWPPKLRNLAPKSMITRAGQGFLQNVAFPLQFEFLFDFPGGLGGGAAGDVEEMSALARLLMSVELSVSNVVGRKRGVAGTITDPS